MPDDVPLKLSKKNACLNQPSISLNNHIHQNCTNLKFVMNFKTNCLGFLLMAFDHAMVLDFLKGVWCGVRARLMLELKFVTTNLGACLSF